MINKFANLDILEYDYAQGKHQHPFDCAQGKH